MTKLDSSEYPAILAVIDSISSISDGTECEENKLNLIQELVAAYKF
jgi:hypothetical protein